LASICVASDRFRITREALHNIELSAYFFAEDQALARNYLDYAKNISSCIRTAAAFPFKRFAIVENFLSTDISCHYTLLAQDCRAPSVHRGNLPWGMKFCINGSAPGIPWREGGNWTEG